MTWTIGQIAHQAGIAPSTIRYYEKIGLLPPALRVNGQRRYNHTLLNTLRIIQQAQLLGFTLTEIRYMLQSFSLEAPPSSHWQVLTPPKLVEIERELARLQAIRQRLIQTLICECATFDECGQHLQL